jgi:protein ImuA
MHWTIREHYIRTLIEHFSGEQRLQTALSMDLHGQFSLSEVLAEPGHGAVAACFGLALAAATAGDSGAILWVGQDVNAAETGGLYGPGLADFGIDSGRLLLVQVRTPTEVLRAALEGARCQALSAVLVEMKAPIDLTASRRLKLAAEASGVRVILVRHADVAMPNAAQARWRVRSAPSAGSTTTGTIRPAFAVTRLKYAGGLPEKHLLLEWDRDQRRFTETWPPAAIPRPVAAVLVRRPLAA